MHRRYFLNDKVSLTKLIKLLVGAGDIIIADGVAAQSKHRIVFNDGDVELYAVCDARGYVTSFDPIKGSVEDVRKTIQLIVDAIHISITEQYRKIKSFITWLGEGTSEAVQS